MRKDKTEGTIPPDFKQHYKALELNQYCTNIKRDIRPNETKPPRNKPCIRGQLVVLTREWRTLDRKGWSHQSMVLGKLDNHTQKNEIGPPFYTTQKINLQWIKYLNTRPDTIKLLEENRKTLSHRTVTFWKWHQKTSNRGKSHQVGLFKLKSSCTEMSTVF